jgi:hypothetical protein
MRMVKVLFGVSLFIMILFGSLEAQNINFTPAAAYPTSASAWFVVGTDLNNDGLTDLVAANSVSSVISTLINTGSGVYQPPINIPITTHPYSIAPADIDGDDDFDIIVANHDAAGSFTIFTNDGTGILTQGITYNAGTWAWSVSTGDFDGDSDFDIALSTEASGTLYIYSNDGTGVFSQTASYFSGNSSHQVLASDIDKDTDLDLIVAGGISNVISVFINTGNGVFDTAVTYPCGDNVISVCVLDIDRDSDLDLVGVNYFSGDVTLLFNDGSANFPTSANYGVGFLPTFIQSADINGGGLNELLITLQTGSDNLVVMQNNGLNAFSPIDTLTIGISPMALYLADLDQDEDFDLAASNIESNDVGVMLNQAALCTYLPGDINGDGHLLGSDVTYMVRYLKGIGNPPVNQCYMDSTSSILYVAADVNGNCEFRGSDITRFVTYFKGISTLSHCHFFPIE